MTLADFRSEMARYGVRTVTVGDWDPGDPAAIFRSIADAFADFAAALGGTPPVREIRFSAAEPDEPNAPASFSAGVLAVHRIIEQRSKWLPAGRSVRGGRYPASGAVVAGVPGQQGGAPLPLPGRAASERRIIVHELGHGVVEAMLTPGVAGADPLDRDLVKRFKRAVGWHGNALFDIQDPAVRAAIERDERPAADAITRDNWNDPRWGEQPITDYPLAGAHEDLPESLMAYIHAPDLLRARSPARHRFFAESRGRWAPILSAAR
jgi:hypothetical protein